MVDFLIGHYTYRMFPPAIDIIPTSLDVADSIGKYTHKKLMGHHVTYSPIPRQYSCFRWPAIESRKVSSSPEGGGGMVGGNILLYPHSTRWRSMAIWKSAMNRIVLGWFGGTSDTITTN